MRRCWLTELERFKWTNLKQRPDWPFARRQLEEFPNCRGLEAYNGVIDIPEPLPNRMPPRWLPLIPLPIGQPPRRAADTVCFVGTLPPRRSQVVNAFKAKGASHRLKFREIKGAGLKRDMEILKCGVLLNVHMFDKKTQGVYADPLEYLRVLIPWVNGLSIVNERSQPLQERLFHNTTIFADYDKLADVLVQEAVRLKSVMDLPGELIREQERRVADWSYMVKEFDKTIDAMREPTTKIAPADNQICV